MFPKCFCYSCSFMRLHSITLDVVADLEFIFICFRVLCVFYWIVAVAHAFA